MRSNRSTPQRIEIWFLGGICLLAFLWYATPQFRESIYFPLQVVRAIFPGMPDLFP
jgi:hypothetical protein